MEHHLPCTCSPWSFLSLPEMRLKNKFISILSLLLAYSIFKFHYVIISFFTSPHLLFSWSLMGEDCHHHDRAIVLQTHFKPLFFFFLLTPASRTREVNADNFCFISDLMYSSWWTFYLHISAKWNNFPLKVPTDFLKAHECCRALKRVVSSNRHITEKWAVLFLAVLECVQFNNLKYYKYSQAFFK